MADSTFSIEQVRLAEARHLPGSCNDEFLRLTRTLIHGPVFQWLLIDAPDESLRRQVITMSKIADILEQLGETDEALLIYRDEVLPVFDSFKGVRSRAITMGKITDILQQRGEMDKAISI